MKKPTRELTTKEKRSIRKLVTDRCANYDREYGCLPLGCECPIFGICYTNSAMCHYFRESVLSNAPELEAAFKTGLIKLCKHCGKPFLADGRRAYCCDNCAVAASREQTAARVRKHRNNKMDM